MLTRKTFHALFYEILCSSREVLKKHGRYSAQAMVTTSNIKALLKAMEFSIEDSSVEMWVKTYPNHSNYKIKVDIEAENIDYGQKIHVEDKTTSNFKAEENFVVLECVNRLLEKAYKPENITLEKKWPTGHGTSGKLDILVARDKHIRPKYRAPATWFGTS